jgi:hypothetical protein
MWTVLRRKIFDDSLGSAYVTAGAVEKEYKPCLWLAWNDVSEKETGESFESLKSVLSVFE